jgi:GxxExxY protein
LQIARKEFLWLRLSRRNYHHLIIQAAFEVHNHLGPGFPEVIYEEAMVRELATRNIPFERQRRVVVNYKEKPLGEFILDLTVKDRIILELKAVSGILRIHEQQALSYFKATGLPLAIIINFGAESVQSGRVANTKGKATLPPRTRVRHVLK